MLYELGVKEPGYYTAGCNTVKNEYKLLAMTKVNVLSKSAF